MMMFDLQHTTAMRQTIWGLRMKGKHVLFTCPHAIAFAAFTMFINSYEVNTSVIWPWPPGASLNVTVVALLLLLQL